MFTRFLLLSVVIMMTETGSVAGDADEQAAKLLAQARSVLAKIDGQVELPGLQQSVEIIRDQWGVAHIYASNSHDLFFAQGYSMALDRLFQVDLWRRIAVGETAEIFGEEAIAADRFARLLRYRGDMKAEWTGYSEDTLEIATAFTQGINACIDAHQDRLPIEFQLAGYRPKHWQPEDILGRMSGIIMSGNWEKEVSRALLIQAVGLEKARLLAPTDPPTLFTPDAQLQLDLITTEILSGLRTATRILRFTPSTSESNNWVVDGRLSASGKPLLASDPHRSTTLPSLRYLVHLNAPGWNVIGSGEPGLPGVAIGHNEQIAWGFTIIGTDQADLFVERTHPDNPDLYQIGDRWEPMTVVRESIEVLGKSTPVELELRYTRHGPVVYQDQAKNSAIALKWAGSEPGSAAYLASLAVSRAQNHEQFMKAISRWKIPCLNFVYADRGGKIGWIAAAATPVRRNGNGLLPVPGSSDDYEWDRYLDVTELPQSFNPKSGWLATANHRIVPDGYSHFVAFDWSAPYRFRRIEERLQTEQPFTIQSFQSIQHDTMSLPARTLQAIIRRIEFPAELQIWSEKILSWDCQLSADSSAGPLYAVWIQELMTAMYALHGTLPEVTERGDLRSIAVILNHLEEPDESWFGVQPVSARNELLFKTLSKAVLRTKELLGNDESAWKWGQLHLATFRHPFENLGPEYARAFNTGSVPRGGDANTPMNTRHDRDFRQIHGATYRHVFDLADWDLGQASSAPGQSGQPGSPHYDDLLPLWADGKYFPLAYSRTKVEEVARNRLLLTPMRPEK